MSLSTFEDPDEQDNESEENLLPPDPDALEEITLVESLQGADGNPVVTVDISSTFSPILDEQQNLPTISRKSLKNLLWMWWNDPEYTPSQKALSDCFGPNPALYYYALKHFSDLGLSFSVEELADLERQLCHHAGCLLSYAHEAYTLPDDTILEFYWYFLVRLLTIEDQVRSYPDSSLKEEHLSMLQDQYAWFLARLHDAKRNGCVTMQSVSGWLEERLLHLGSTYPHLGHLIMPLLKTDAVEEAAQTVHEIWQGIWDRYSMLFSQEQEQSEGWQADKILQENIQQTLSRLRLAMVPHVRDRAWKHPIEYIAQCAGDKKIIFIDQVYALDPKEDGTLQRVDEVELALLRSVTSPDTALVFANAQLRVCPFHDILEEHKTFRSIKEIIEDTERYVNGESGVKSLKEILGIEGEVNPHVRDFLTYWEAVRSEKEGNRVFLVNGLLAAEQEKILQISPAFSRTVILGEGGAVQMLFQQKISLDDVLMIHHQVAYREYPEDHVCIPGCLGYIAYECANKYSWGDFESSAVSLQDNRPLIDAVLHEDLQDQRNEFVQTYAFLLDGDADHRNWICKDMILFTKHDDEGDGGCNVHPVHSDSYVPVGS